MDAGAAGSFKLIGDPTIRGNTKEAALNVEGPTPPVKGMGGPRIGATATTKNNRLEYGLKWSSMLETGPVVGGLSSSGSFSGCFPITSSSCMTPAAPSSGSRPC